MRFETPLIPGTLIRRYKRFLADIRLEDGREITAHCANPGAMTGLNAPGLQVWLEPNDDPKRKLKFSWKLVELPGGHWAGIDTAIPNKVAGEALREEALPPFAGYDHVKAEVPYGENSRIDFLLTAAGRPDCYVEVKNVHLRRTEDWAEFPDSVTKRGAKHLDELAAVVAAGGRAAMLYLVQRTDCARFRLAEDIDPGYAAAFRRAREAGVEAHCFSCHIGRDEITLDTAVPVLVDSVG